jgi:hypothetical protein
MNIVSFLAPRPEHPRWMDYLPHLAVLQRSCDRLDLRHVVITDDPSLPHERFECAMPRDLMPAVIAGQLAWLRDGDWRNDGTCFVGADCLFLQDPTPYLAGIFDMAVTYRGPHSRYPINTGLVYVSGAARERVAAMFAGMLKRVGKTWCDDQRAIQTALSPLPNECGVYSRAGMAKVGFLPMGPFNSRPASVEDSMAGRVMLHFRGKADMKALMLGWARRHLPDAGAG